MVNIYSRRGFVLYGVKEWLLNMQDILNHCIEIASGPFFGEHTTTSIFSFQKCLRLFLETSCSLKMFFVFKMWDPRNANQRIPFFQEILIPALLLSTHQLKAQILHYIVILFTRVFKTTHGLLQM